MWTWHLDVLPETTKVASDSVSVKPGTSDAPSLAYVTLCAASGGLGRCDHERAGALSSRVGGVCVWSSCGLVLMSASRVMRARLRMPTQKDRIRQARPMTSCTWAMRLPVVSMSRNRISWSRLAM